jgi:peptidoglycan hydrolase-like protein with peptidoglycan-binding domain
MGDTLYSLAKKHGTTVAALRRANGLSGSLIVPGETLKLPNASSAAKPSPSAAHPRALLVGRQLARGDAGADVATLQKLLKVSANGTFGPETERAVRVLQRAHGLNPDGVVSKRTLDALTRRGSPTTVVASAPRGSGSSAPSTRGARTSAADAWRSGRRIGPIKVVTIDGKPVEKQTADALLRMRAAAKRDGVHIRVVSGFRSYTEQDRLYSLYLAGRGNLAARPGYSNHQDGHALDLNASAPGVYSWLSRRGRSFGFIRTVPSENWHWEYRP